MSALSLTERPRLGNFTIAASLQFAEWLAELDISLAVSTYQSGNLILIGRNPATGGISIRTQLFPRPMGIAFDGHRLAIATLRELLTFVTEAGDDYDTVFVPQHAFMTALIDAHDLAFSAKGNLIFVNTRYSCLATASVGHRFRVLWRPPFISKHAPEDRCHLNGLAMRDGRPAFVTAIAETDTVYGWREKRATGGGILMDVAANTIVCRRLWMPHSPRWHENRLWILNSGSGEIGIVDVNAGRFDPMAFCPGYLRGLAFIGDYALVGLSKPRGIAQLRAAVPLQERLAATSSKPRCAVYVIDTRSGNLVHWLEIEGVVNELYDIVVLSGIKRPTMAGRFTGKGELAAARN